MDHIDELRLSISSVKSNSEINSQRLSLRLEQLEAKLGKRNISPSLAAVLAALLGIVGAALGAYFQGRSSLSVEQLKFESTLVLDALKAETQEDAAKKLDFLVKAKLIDGRGGAIERLAKQPMSLPIRTLEMRLHDLEVETLVSRCLARDGIINYGTLTCQTPDGGEESLRPRSR